MKFTGWVIITAGLLALLLVVSDAASTIPWRMWADMVMQYDLVSIIGGM